MPRASSHDKDVDLDHDIWTYLWSKTALVDLIQSTPVFSQLSLSMSVDSPDETYRHDM